MDWTNAVMQTFGDIWAFLVGLAGGQVWLLLVVSILLATLLIDVITKLILSRVHAKLVQKQRHMLDAFVDGARAPLSLFIWLNGLVLALTTFLMKFALFMEAIPWIHSTKSSVLILALGWFVIRVANRLEDDLKEVAKRDPRFDEATVEALTKLIKLTAFIITGLVVLSAYGANLTGLLAFGGMGGIAVGFAAKDLLGNLFGGLMLYLDKPFKVGDWIRSPDRELEGTVERIGWRMTVIRTFDKRPLYVPNGIFSDIAIENPSRMTNRRIKEVMGIRYCDVEKMRHITADIRHMLNTHPEIDQNQTIIVNFLEFADSSLNFMVYTFTRTTNWIKYHQVKEEILLLIADIVAKHGAEMAFPTRSLYVEDAVKLAIQPSENLPRAETNR